MSSKCTRCHFSGVEPYVLDPDKVNATRVTMQGIVGESETLTMDYLKTLRNSTIAYHVAKHMVFEKLRDANEAPRLHLIPAAKRIVNQWLNEGHLVCKGGTVPAQLLYRELADEVCELIFGALIDAARIEEHPKVISYAKNHNLGFEVPYLLEAEPKNYRPDFLITLGAPEPTTLIIEVKGFRGLDAMIKADTIANKWVPAINRNGKFGRWGFAELRSVHDFGPDLDAAIDKLLIGETT